MSSKTWEYDVIKKKDDVAWAQAWIILSKQHSILDVPKFDYPICGPFDAAFLSQKLLSEYIYIQRGAP